MESRWEAGFRIPEVVACKWSLEILRALTRRPMRFSEILSHLRINSRILSDRLCKLSSYSLVMRGGDGRYLATEKGAELIQSFSILLEHGLSASTIEDVLRCKWMKSILESLYHRELYASEILNAVPGIRWKILSERLRKLEAHGLVDREVIPTHPIRVRYRLTRKGRILAGWILMNKAILPVRL